MEDLPLGARLRITIDHEPATRNLPRSARDWGQDVTPAEPDGPGVWRIDIIKRVP